MPQIQLPPPADKNDSRSPVIERLIRQGSVGGVTPRADAAVHTNGPQRQKSPRIALADAIWDERADAQGMAGGPGRGRGSTARQQRQRSNSSSTRQRTPRGDAKVTPRGGLLQRLASSGFEASALTECIGSGGTDLLFDALSHYQGGST